MGCYLSRSLQPYERSKGGRGSSCPTRPWTHRNCLLTGCALLTYLLTYLRDPEFSRKSDEKCKRAVPGNYSTLHFVSHPRAGTLLYSDDEWVAMYVNHSRSVALSPMVVRTVNDRSSYNSVLCCSQSFRIRCTVQSVMLFNQVILFLHSS